jgi:glutamate/tyrosine decarboxylase-like PLP-dependent enzyme
VAADDQGRTRVDALAEQLSAGSGPAIVCLQAGNLHSGAFDPLGEAIAVAKEHDAWVHVDGAFGLWAGASPRLRHLVDGYEGADSWATDAHKTLNVPYDCGVIIVARPRALRAAMGMQASYLVRAEGPGDPLDKVPELSRRARGVPVWATLRSLGRSGVVELVDGLADNARVLADGDRRHRRRDHPQRRGLHAGLRHLRRRRQDAGRHRPPAGDGTAWMSGSRWAGRDVLRISVSNWSTDERDVALTVDAVRRASAG